MYKYIQVNKIFSSDYGLFESPRWDKWNRCLWFVSIDENTIHAIDCCGSQYKQFLTNSEVSFVTPVDSDHVIYAETHGIYKLNHLTRTKTLIDRPNLADNVRFNDAVIDSSGRILIGTKAINDESPVRGQLLLVPTQKDDVTGVRVLVDTLRIPNGLALNNDETELYFAESAHRTVYKYAYDLKFGKISHRTKFATFPEGISPDGIALTKQGLWIAEWSGSRVGCWNIHSQTRISQVDLEDKNVSACTIGAGNKLFITTARAVNEQIEGANIYSVALSDKWATE